MMFSSSTLRSWSQYLTEFSVQKKWNFRYLFLLLEPPVNNLTYQFHYIFDNRASISITFSWIPWTYQHPCISIPRHVWQYDAACTEELLRGNIWILALLLLLLQREEGGMVDTSGNRIELNWVEYSCWKTHISWEKKKKTLKIMWFSRRPNQKVHQKFLLNFVLLLCRKKKNLEKFFKLIFVKSLF